MEHIPTKNIKNNEILVSQNQLIIILTQNIQDKLQFKVAIMALQQALKEILWAREGKDLQKRNPKQLRKQ